MSRTPDPGSPATSPSAALSFRSVVHVNEKGGRFGGTEEYLALLTGELDRRDVRSHLVCGWVGDVSDVPWSSVDVVEGLAARTVRPQTGAEVAAIVDALHADVVYVHNVFDPGVIAALAGRPDRPVVLWYVHDHYVTCLTELRWRRDLGPCPVRLGPGCLEAIDGGACVRRHTDRSFDVVALLERQQLAAGLGDVDAVVVVSPYMGRLLAEAGVVTPERIHLLDRPIRQIGADRARPRQRGEPATIVYAGRITPEKGLHVLIDAVGSLPVGTPVTLRIAGVAEDLEYRSRCQRLGAAAQATNPALIVEWCGHLDYDGIDELLLQADIVAASSLWPEPLGATALEAMSAGAAVVASDVGGLGTAIVNGRNGVLVQPGDTAAWARALAALVDDRGCRERLAREGQRDVRRHAIARHVDDLAGIVAAVRHGRQGGAARIGGR